MRPGQTEARQRDAAGGGDLVSQLERERTEKEELRLRVDALQVELGAVGRREVLSNAIPTRVSGREVGATVKGGWQGMLERYDEILTKKQKAEVLKKSGYAPPARHRASAFPLPPVAFPPPLSAAPGGSPLRLIPAPIPLATRRELALV